jgi:hypothetical protein
VIEINAKENMATGRVAVLLLLLLLLLLVIVSSSGLLRKGSKVK